VVKVEMPSSGETVASEPQAVRELSAADAVEASASVSLDCSLPAPTSSSSSTSNSSVYSTVSSGDLSGIACSGPGANPGEEALDDEGISDAELAAAHVRLRNMLQSRGGGSPCHQPPLGMALLNEGRMGRGGTWQLWGATDLRSGRVQLFLKGHFGVPLEVKK
jgi:hypothetical protein